MNLSEINIFKHVEITPHPLKAKKYMVINKTFPFIPPYIGTLRQCEKAAIYAEKNSEKLLLETKNNKK